MLQCLYRPVLLLLLCLPVCISADRPAAQRHDYAVLLAAFDYYNLAPDDLNWKFAGTQAERRASTAPGTGNFDDNMVFIKGGRFLMGCTSEPQDCYENERPTHQVVLSDFYIGRFEVTQQQWTQMMDSNPSRFKGCDQCPVENVNWDDVQTFLQKLNDKYPGRNYRLPTEAEWEYAARGGGKAVLFGNGKDVIDPKEINFEASAFYQKPYSIAGEYRGKTVPVGSLNSPNALGLHDLSGNVLEWCSDWYDAYSKKPQKNPKGPASGSYRVCRGGSWYDVPRNCRVTIRNYDALGGCHSYLGFRLARSK